MTRGLTLSLLVVASILGTADVVFAQQLVTFATRFATELMTANRMIIAIFLVFAAWSLMSGDHDWHQRLGRVAGGGIIAVGALIFSTWF